MRIESIRLKNFKSCSDLTLTNFAPLSVFVAIDGADNSVAVSALKFLQAVYRNGAINAAGQFGGFEELRAPGATGPMEIALTVRHTDDETMCYYTVHFDERGGVPYAARERLVISDWEGDEADGRVILDMVEGKGDVALMHAQMDEYLDNAQLGDAELADELRFAILVSILEFFPSPQPGPKCRALGSFLDCWHFSDITERPGLGPNDLLGGKAHLLASGLNLPLVLCNLYDTRRDIYRAIADAFQVRVPGIQRIDAKLTKVGKLLWSINGRDFHDPAAIPQLSDEAIRLLQLLVLLHDPKPAPLLVVQDAEAGIAAHVLPTLTGLLRDYARRGGQVYVTTKCREFLNELQPEEIFLVCRGDRSGSIRRLADIPGIANLVESGEKPGDLLTTGKIEAEIL